MSDNALFKDLPEPIRQHIDTLERMRADFVANVSHELRTPLTVIMGYLDELVDEEGIEDELKGILNLMHQQSVRMKAIIDNLLLLSKIESEEIKPTDATPVSIAAMINDCVRAGQQLADEKKQQLIIESVSETCLYGNADELQSLVTNLLFNAIKYTDPGGSITLAWKVINGTPTLSVTDTGIGIAQEHLPRLTERFYRVDKGRSRDSGGTGLGLAIVKHILIRHAGHLEIESAEGQGSTFRCVFTVL